jgi:site-specific DNA-cytosine methylase
MRQRRKKELEEKQRKSGKVKASPSACNAGKYLSPKTKHTRSDRKERNAMLALPNSHRKLCTRRAKDNGTIGEVASPVSGQPKTRGSRGEERQLSLLLLARLLEILN